MTRSERRLHPLSFLFTVATQARALILPLIFVVISSRASATWELVAVIWLIPYAVFALVSYFTFTYEYAAEELVIRKGLLFRSERHIPYYRIQNIQSVQNPFHRLLRVAEARVETAGGTEPEAVLRVLPAPAVEEMRRRVGEAKQQRMPPAVPAPAAQGGIFVPEAVGQPGGAVSSGATESARRLEPAPRVLVRLSTMEILLSGLLHSRPSVAVAATLGVAWELGLLGRVESVFFGKSSMVGEGMFRRLAQIVFDSGEAALGDFLFIPVALIVLLAVLRLFSMAWAVVRLHGFTLTRTGEDLTFTSGLLTQRKGSIPLRRIQTVTLRENPWQRLAGRLTVRVETAGGAKREDGAQRVPLVPILRREELPRLLAEIAPEVDLEAAAWEGLDPRGRRRAAKRALIFALPLAALLWPAGWWSLAVIVPVVLFLAFAARREVALMRYASAPWGIAWRSGWLWRSLTLARHARLQVVTLHESPFDRRYDMASLAVDTAGAGGAGHKIRIPYLARPLAEGLQARLTAEAAQTAFHW